MPKPISTWKLFPQVVHQDQRGKLSAIDDRDFSEYFEIKRVFFQTESRKDLIRGGHAHKVCHQLIIPVVGEFTCEILSSDSRERIQLRQDDTFLYVPPLTWIEQHSFSENSVVAIFASHYYDPDDYIRDYATFLEFCVDNQKKSS